MLDWLKFFPLSVEQDSKKKPTEIRGPYFSKLRKNKWRFGDSIFHFNAPWANPIFGVDGSGRTVDAILPGRRNILTAQLSPLYGSSDAPPSLWDKGLFYNNTWFFVGPWFVGEKARLKSGAVLLSARQGSSFSETNLFHPRVFESAIANFLDHSYGYRRSGKKPDYCGPLNWRVQPLSSSIKAVVCDIHFIANGGRDNPNLRRFVFFPVGSQQFVRIVFDFGMPINFDAMRFKHLLSLSNDIINSMYLEVGQSTQAEWNKVKATCPDMSITETFGELSWPLYKETPSKKPKEVDITRSNNPKAVPHKK